MSCAGAPVRAMLGLLPPRQAQPSAAFGGRPVPVVSRSDFSGSGFSRAHQKGAREVAWTVASSLPPLVGDLLAQGEAFVYAYYEGIDKVAHAAGLGALYDAELAFVDRLVGDVMSVLPPGAALAVTSDHGQVDVGARPAPRRLPWQRVPSLSAVRHVSAGCTAGPARLRISLELRPGPLWRRGVGGQPGRSGGTRSLRWASPGRVPGPPGRCRHGAPGPRRLPGPRRWRDAPAGMPARGPHRGRDVRPAFSRRLAWPRLPLKAARLKAGA